jgi:hypothetical protein
MPKTALQMTLTKLMLRYIITISFFYSNKVSTQLDYHKVHPISDNDSAVFMPV